MLEIEGNTHWNIIGMIIGTYHWNDPSWHLHAYRQHEVVCVTCFQVNN